MSRILILFPISIILVLALAFNELKGIEFKGGNNATNGATIRDGWLEIPIFILRKLRRSWLVYFPLSSWGQNSFFPHCLFAAIEIKDKKGNFESS